MTLKVPRRALYPFTCNGCGKRRYTRKYRRALVKLCNPCTVNAIPNNQPSLFPDPIISKGDINKVSGSIDTINFVMDKMAESFSRDV